MWVCSITDLLRGITSAWIQFCCHAFLNACWKWMSNQLWKFKCRCIYEKTIQIAQTRACQGPLFSPYNWAQCCYCIHQWKRPTFCPHRYRTNIVQTPQPLFHVKGAVLKVDGAVDLGSFSNEIFNEPMFCAVGQLLATLLGFVEGHLGWMSPFSCIVEEYHDNVAWCHSCLSSLKQGGYCSKMKQGGVGYSDCAMDLTENRTSTSSYWKLYGKKI